MNIVASSYLDRRASCDETDTEPKRVRTAVFHYIEALEND